MSSSRLAADFGFLYQTLVDGDANPALYYRRQMTYRAGIWEIENSPALHKQYIKLTSGLADIRRAWRRYRDETLPHKYRLRLAQAEEEIDAQLESRRRELAAKHTHLRPLLKSTACTRVFHAMKRALLVRREYFRLSAEYRAELESAVPFFQTKQYGLAAEANVFLGADFVSILLSDTHHGVVFQTRPFIPKPKPKESSRVDDKDNELTPKQSVESFREEGLENAWWTVL